MKPHFPLTTLFLPFGSEDYEVDIQVLNADWDGIGAYECHGYKGFDKGFYSVTEWEIEGIRYVDGGAVPGAEGIIRKMYDDADFCGAVQEELDLWIGEYDRESAQDD